MLASKCVNKGVLGHQCQLPNDEPALNRFIQTGMFVYARRRWRKFLMVSPYHPKTKGILKSTAEIRREEERHLLYHYYMIHPFSEARAYWETLMMVVFFLFYILLPFDITMVYTSDAILIPVLVLDVIAFIDIILQFCTGYYDLGDHKIVLNPLKCLMHYFYGYFLIDLLSSIPVNLIVNQTQMLVFWYLKLFLILKLFRLGTFFLYLQQFCCERLNVWTYNFRTIRLSIIILVIILWFTSFTRIVHILALPLQYYFYTETIWLNLKHMIDCCLEAITRLFLIASANAIETNELYILFDIFCVLFGSIFMMFILAQIMQIYQLRSSSTTKYENLVQQVEEYMNYRALPNRLRQRILLFLECKFQKHIYREDDIMKILSTTLKQDILLHSCLVNQVELFKDLPPIVLLRIITKLQLEIFLSNDVIVQEGVEGHTMYFIYRGVVAIFTSKGKEICHLDDGCHFGEIAVAINVPRIATVVAITECELYRLTRKDFQEAIAPYPELHAKIINTAEERWKNTKKITDISTDITDPRVTFVN